MPKANGEVLSGRILPAPACDLIDRLSNQFDLPFTLTDIHGAVVASTGGRLAGQVNPSAARVARSGNVEHADDEPAVYVPVSLSGKTAGVLIAHGPPDAIHDLAQTCAIAIGMALDFAEAASTLGRDHINPGWLLYRLLRGSRAEANQARVVAAVYGWNLFKQRVAVVILAPSAVRQFDAHRGDPLATLQDALGSTAAATPYGQIAEKQWVLLPQYEPKQAESQVYALAQRVHAGFVKIGIDNSVGIGYAHLPVNPVQAVRWSYREAVFAARVGPGLHGRGVYDLRRLGTLAFFAPSAYTRRRLAGLVLDPLEKHVNLMETLRAFLDANMSVAEVAEQLNMHRHTVRNHLDRVRELTGLDPRVLEDAVQLKLALITKTSTEGEST